MRPDFFITKPRQFTDPSNLGNLIRTLNVWTFDPASRERFFWISDLIQLARKEVLRSYWSISNVEVETQLAAKRAPFWKYELGASDMSMSSEQLLTKSFLVRAGHVVELEKYGRIKPSRHNFDLAQHALSRYFEIAHWNDSGLFVPNRFRLMNSFLVLNAPLRSGGFFCARLRHFLNREHALNFVSGLLRAASTPIWRKVRHRYLVQKGAILR